VTRKGSQADVEAKEKAEKQAQKRKGKQVSKASKVPLAKAKSPIKPRKAPVYKKKVVRFVSSDPKGVAPVAAQKRTSFGRVVKTPVIFEKGT
jgi:hypothetical protein